MISAIIIVATRATITYLTITSARNGHTARISIIITTTIIKITIATIRDIIDTTTFTTITIELFNTMTGTTSVIIKITSDTGAATLQSEVKTNDNNNNNLDSNIIPLVEIELAEWVGFNKYDDNFFIIINDR